MIAVSLSVTIESALMIGTDVMMWMTAVMAAMRMAVSQVST